MGVSMTLAACLCAPYSVSYSTFSKRHTERRVVPHSMRTQRTTSSTFTLGSSLTQMYLDPTWRPKHVRPAKWTADIHREWIDTLIRNEPHRDRATLEHTRDLMDQTTRDCLVTGYGTLISALDLPDPQRPSC